MHVFRVKKKNTMTFHMKCLPDREMGDFVFRFLFICIFSKFLENGLLFVQAVPSMRRGETCGRGNPSVP